MTSTDTIRTTLVVDAGPVADAAAILAERSTLASHVAVTRGKWTTEVTITDDVPFDLWGSGTQALWLLLSAMAYSSETVSLYAAASRLDTRNSIAAAEALYALFGGPR